jgi:hypothetical protein
MKRLPGEWEKNVERLVKQCADKVSLELEEIIMKRLREAGEAVIQAFFQDQVCPGGAATEDQAVSAAESEEIKPQVLQALSSEGEAADPCQVSERCDFSRADPPLSSKEDVLYAFGIVKVNPEEVINLLGMEDRPCRIVENGDLGMLVCPVSRQEYTEESLHRYLEDMAWVESHAHHHEETLLKTMEGRSLIPLPFCTIFTDEENIKRQLARNAERLQADLQRLENHYELQVKLLVKRKLLLEKLRQDLPYSGEQSGGGYFQKRQWEKKLQEVMERLMDDYGESLYQDLNNISAEVSLLDKAGVLVEEGQQLVFAAHYLIAQERRAEWDKKLAEFDEVVDPLGFMLDVSGPWPPYHFARLINEEETIGG